MSIFDSRTTVLDTYGNADETFLLISRGESEEWPLVSLSEDLRFEERIERELYLAGEVKGTATWVRTDDEHMGDAWVHHVFKVAMTYHGRRMQATFRVGTGWNQAPSVNDVLASMVSDYRLTEHESADSLGYGSERARQIDRAIDNQTARLRRFIPNL